MFAKFRDINLVDFPVQKLLEGEWVQALGTVTSGIVQVDKTSVSYDWSMVFKATINQSQVTLAHPNDPRNRSAQSLYPFP